MRALVVLAQAGSDTAMEVADVGVIHERRSFDARLPETMGPFAPHVHPGGCGRTSPWRLGFKAHFPLVLTVVGRTSIG